jgi:hypothetical protein
LGQFSKNYRTFYSKNCHYALKNMGLGSEIRDSEKTYSGSRIQRSKRHRIPDPDPQHWDREYLSIKEDFTKILKNVVHGNRSQKPVFRIHEILVWIRIRGSMPMIYGSGSGFAFFVIDLQDASKKHLLFFEGTSTLFFKDKKSKIVTK